MKKKTFIPLYQTIYADLREKIMSGVYPPGSQLPYEHALCAEFNVERVTVRRALDLLVKENLIEKRAGVGSFVIERNGAPIQNGQARIILFIMQNNQNDIRHNTTAFNALLYFPTEHACKEAGYSLLYVSAQSGEDVVTLSRQHDIAGIFLVSTVSDAITESVVSLGIPTICINTYEPRLISILPDNISGVRAALRHLVQSGHRKIAFVGGMPGAFNAEERMAGYREALSEHGIDFCPSLTAVGNWTFDGGRAAIASVMDAAPANGRPTAVFAASDMMAIGVMDAMRQAGLRVPEDISVVGFDDIDMCNFCSPTLTSISIDVRQMAVVSVEHMKALIQRGVTPNDRYMIRLPATLVKRNSVHTAETRQ